MKNKYLLILSCAALLSLAACGVNGASSSVSSDEPDPFSSSETTSSEVSTPATTSEVSTPATPSEEVEEVEIYIRGSVGDSNWAAVDANKLVAVEGQANTYSIEVELVAGAEFKFADATWAYETTSIPADSTDIVKLDGGNLSVVTSGVYTFTVNTETGAITYTRVDLSKQEVSTVTTYYIKGDHNGWADAAMNKVSDTKYTLSFYAETDFEFCVHGVTTTTYDDDTDASSDYYYKNGGSSNFTSTVGLNVVTLDLENVGSEVSYSVSTPMSIDAAYDVINTLDNQVVASDMSIIKGIVVSTTVRTGGTSYVLADTLASEKTVTAYLAVVANETVATPVPGDTIIVTGYFEKFNTTMEIYGPKTNPNPIIRDVTHAEYDISASGDHATVTGLPESGKVTSGTDYSFTVTPDTGYQITSVKFNNAKVEANADGTYTITGQLNNVITVVAEEIVSGPISNKVVTGDNFASTTGTIDNVISYSCVQGGGTAAPNVTSVSGSLYLYQPGSNKTFGGYVTISAAEGYKINSVTITISTASKSMATSVAYSIDSAEGENLSSNISLEKGASTTVTVDDDKDGSKVSFYCMGSTSSYRTVISSISVTYSSVTAE